MARSRVPASLLSLALLTSACNEEVPSDEEVGDSGDSTTDDVSTFEDSSDSSSDTTDSDTTESSSTTDTDTTDTDTTDTSDTTETDTTETDTTETDTTETDTTETDTTETDTTEGDEAPFVVSTLPVGLVTGISPTTSIAVTFSEAMDPATVTTNTANEECTGTIQVSFDNFFSCVQMSAGPATNDNLTFTLEPAGPLASATTYQIKVLSSVTDAGGTAMADVFTSEGFTVRYHHTIVLDGSNDFTAEETFNSSTLGHVGYVAWDESYVYLGMNSPDLGGNSNQIWFVGYLGGMPGSGSGVTYNTQQPLIPFDARWHLRWRASDDFGGALEWNGMTWINPGFGPIAGSADVAFSGTFVEMRVAWADLGDPDLLQLHMGMLREQAFNEASWAAVPGNSYVDSYDPNYTHYFEFDVLGSTLPADHAPL